jgi:hypothetical protein
MLRLVLGSILASALLALAAAVPAAADDGPRRWDPCSVDRGSAFGTGTGTGTGRRRRGDNPCQNIPEAPVAIAYVIAAGALVGGVVLVRRRRGRVAPA